LSSKAKKGKAEAKKPTKEAIKAEREYPKPVGRFPQASVMSRHGDGMIARLGRGFSAGELSAAGFPIRLAARWGVPIDVRRRSLLEANVQSLKKWYSPAAKETREPPRAKPSPAKKPKQAEKPAKKRPIRKKKATS